MKVQYCIPPMPREAAYMHALLEQHIRQNLGWTGPLSAVMSVHTYNILIMGAHKKGLSGQAAVTPGSMKGVSHLKEAALWRLISCAVFRWLQQCVQWASAHPCKLLCYAQPHVTHVGIRHCWQRGLLHLHMTCATTMQHSFWEILLTPPHLVIKAKRREPFYLQVLQRLGCLHATLWASGGACCHIMALVLW